MAYDEITALLGGWGGFEIMRVRRETPRGTGSQAPAPLTALAQRSRIRNSETSPLVFLLR